MMMMIPGEKEKIFILNFLTLTGEIWAKPLSCVVIEETLGVGKPHYDITWSGFICEIFCESQDQVVHFSPGKQEYLMTVSTGKMSESPEPLWEPCRTAGGGEQ